MNTLLLLLVPLLLAQLHPIPKVCSIGTFNTTTVRVYACTTGETGASSAGPYALDTAVSKAWFRAHCTKKDANKAPSYGTVAVCDAYAVADPALTVKDAAGPSKVKQRIETVMLGTALGFIVVACIAGGGCAFAR